MKPVDSLSDDEFARLVERAVALPDAPPALVQAAVDLFAASGAPAEAATLKDVAQAAWRLVAATLAFDSAAAPQVAWGVRGAGAGTRHLLFSAQGRDIDLRIVPALDHFSITGQILGPDAAGTVELLRDPANGSPAAQAHAVPLDPLGEFRLDGVRVGTYRLTLRVGPDEIVLPPIAIGPQPR